VQPLFANNALDRDVFVATLVIWRLLELGVDIRTIKRRRASIQREDKGSRLVLVGLIALGVFAGIALSLTFSPTAITRGSSILFWLGILVMYAGIALRIYAIRVLGVFFTTTVAVATGQTVVESGPYRRIRHPSYTGILMILLGLGLSLTNWLSVLIILGCALIGFIYRIRVEEAVLQEQLGKPYQDYMQRTKRLIPFVV
jgi:protein-S-isoprenylcysteine O-methyltransferase Ste14